MESHAIPVGHGLDVQGVVETSEYRIVHIAYQQRYLRRTQVTVEERLEVRVEFRETVDYHRVVVKNDDDVAFTACLFYGREQVDDVFDLDFVSDKLTQHLGVLVEVV